MGNILFTVYKITFYHSGRMAVAMEVSYGESK